VTTARRSGEFRGILGAGILGVESIHGVGEIRLAAPRVQAVVWQPRQRLAATGLNRALEIETGDVKDRVLSFGVVLGIGFISLVSPCLARPSPW